MNLSPRASLFVISIGIVLIILVAIGLFFTREQTATTQVPTTQTANLMNVTDIDRVYVHSGLQIDCPDLQGAAQHGYVYTAVLNDNRVIERLGCGVGEPEVYAEAIARDLEATALFGSISASALQEKLTFKLYTLQ